MAPAVSGWAFHRVSPPPKLLELVGCGGPATRPGGRVEVNTGADCPRRRESRRAGARACPGHGTPSPRPAGAVSQREGASYRRRRLRAPLWGAWRRSPVSVLVAYGRSRRRDGRRDRRHDRRGLQTRALGHHPRHGPFPQHGKAIGLQPKRWTTGTLKFAEAGCARGRREPPLRLAEKAFGNLVRPAWPARSGQASPAFNSSSLTPMRDDMDREWITRIREVKEFIRKPGISQRSFKPEKKPGKRERKYLMSTDKRAGSLEEKSAGIRNVIARTILFPACAAIRLVRRYLFTDHVSASYLENEY